MDNGDNNNYYKLETPNNEQIKFDYTESFDISTNNIKYQLKLSYNEKLLFFEIEKTTEFPKKEYSIY